MTASVTKLADGLAFPSLKHEYFLSCLFVCVQDGGRALEEGLCYNTSVTQLDVRLTGADEQSTSFILQALLANAGLDEQKNVEKCEIEGNIDKNIADLLENMTTQE